MQKRIVRRVYKEDLPALFGDIHPILSRIYAAREVASEAELDNSLEKLHPYQLLKGIDEAVDVLAKAILAEETILIVGDFDADGATSSAVAMRALKSFGANKIHYLVPNRFAYGYGLTPELVAVAETYQPSLIVTVDNGIVNHAGVLAAKERGIKVLITDHHLPAATLPIADAIVNPNQQHDTFPSKNLAGVGVIFYVMLALRRHLLSLNWFAKNALPEPNMARLLDLVALGTVADLVPLDHNNRILIQHGLKRIRAGQCAPGIVALLELASRDFTRATAADLGFAVASRLNAAGRLDDMSLGIECLLSDDSVKVREIARMLNELNEERKYIESDMQLQAMEVLNKLNLQAQGELPKGLCLFDESWHQGVIGILAARIKDKFNRPVVVFAPNHATELKGSARSIAGLHIRDAFAQIDSQYPALITKFGGHAMAAGLTLARDALEKFTQVFNEVVSQQLTAAQLEHCMLSDGELTENDLDLAFASLLREAGPWGQAFPEPLFDDKFTVLEQRLVGDKHLKLRLCKQEKIIEAMAFFVDTQKWPNHRCQTIHAAYRLDVNEYKGRRNLQLIVDYLEPA